MVFLLLSSSPPPPLLLLLSSSSSPPLLPPSLQGVFYGLNASLSIVTNSALINPNR
jgi:hypothetical protein